MKPQHQYIKIAIADDHNTVREGISLLLNNFENCRVTYEASNGEELVNMIHDEHPPDIAILDLSMPVMNGYQTANILASKFPKIKILILSMCDPEFMIADLVSSKVRGILNKDNWAYELKIAINHIMAGDNFYFQSNTINKIVNHLNRQDRTDHEKERISELEYSFFNLIPSDLTYQEIAVEMNINPRVVDSLRDKAFARFNVRSRAGLVKVLLKNGIVRL